MTHMPFLSEVIFSMTLVEYGKQELFRQSRENVRSESHQDLLDEIWSHVVLLEPGAFSDCKSESTWFEERDYEFISVDWVKVSVLMVYD